GGVGEVPIGLGGDDLRGLLAGEAFEGHGGHEGAGAHGAHGEARVGGDVRLDGLVDGLDDVVRVAVAAALEELWGAEDLEVGEAGAAPLAFEGGDDDVLGAHVDADADLAAAHGRPPRGSSRLWPS